MVSDVLIPAAESCPGRFARDSLPVIKFGEVAEVVTSFP
jgi:hypothetical protein